MTHDTLAAGHTRTCVRCLESFVADSAHGRPRKVCPSCHSEKGARASQERRAECCACGGVTFQSLYHHKRGSKAWCRNCWGAIGSPPKRASMTEPRRQVMRLITDARRRRRELAKNIYLEARCVVCHNPVWLDSHALANKQRTCGMQRCKHRKRWATEKWVNDYTNKNHIRRTIAKQGDEIDRQIVWERDFGICHICNEGADKDNWHLEHIIPVSRGGAHTYDNVAVSHPACNLAKGAKLAA